MANPYLTFKADPSNSYPACEKTRFWFAADGGYAISESGLTPNVFKVHFEAEHLGSFESFAEAEACAVAHFKKQPVVVVTFSEGVFQDIDANAKVPFSLVVLEIDEGKAVPLGDEIALHPDHSEDDIIRMILLINPC